MEGLSLSIATTSSTSGNVCNSRLRVPFSSNFRNFCRTNISLLPRKPRNKLLVFAASDNESEVRKWVSMELEWGSLTGEDPELTLVKIVGRKSYPGLTDSELHELYEKKGKAAFPEIDELPLDLSEIKRKPGISETNEVPSNVCEKNGLKLVLPVPKKGLESKSVRKPNPYILENREKASQKVEAVVNNAVEDNSPKAIPKNNSIPSGTSTIVSHMQKPQKVNVVLNADPKQESNSGVSMETVNVESSSKVVEHENSINPAIKECEDRDWARAEDLIKEGEREEVELINASTGGFVVFFGSLIGVLPYQNVATRWRYLPFESWLRMKGLDPSKYKNSLGIVGKYEPTKVDTSLDSSVNSEASNEVKAQCETSIDLKLDDLLVIYEKDRLKHASSFVGQKFKVYVVLADRESRKLIFSSKQKEKEDSIKKKKRLMAKLSIGDVVKCCIKKITYFGIFVEVEGVPALIHLTELPWHNILDLSSHYKRDQVIEAKVNRLDFTRGHILLSLKEITPDPLIETLESAHIDQASMKAVKADTEVYMPSMFKNQYKLLARSGNKVQKVLVKTPPSI